MVPVEPGLILPMSGLVKGLVWGLLPLYTPKPITSTSMSPKIIPLGRFRIGNYFNIDELLVLFCYYSFPLSSPRQTSWAITACIFVPSAANFYFFTWRFHQVGINQTHYSLYQGSTPASRH